VAKQTRVISVVGKKNCGKTTLVVALAKEFARKGRDVGTIKHGTHPAKIDVESTDTWKHANEGSARRVLLDAPGSRVLFEHKAEAEDPLNLVSRYFADADVVILEGYTRTDVPKIEVYRSELHDSPHWSAHRENAGTWFAMLSDETKLDLPFPKFRFNDTAWLVAITAMAWDNALVIDA
jgi:molybdopterin-guanine dinucleotide biosynthesis adapter protein